MSGTFSLADPDSLGDLVTFVDRASRLEDGSMRLICAAGVLAAYAAVLYPTGLLDESPTVLGLRTFATLPGQEDFDEVVPLRSLRERLARAEREHRAALEAEREPDSPVPLLSIGVPLAVHTVTWAAISPPRGGWKPVGQADSGTLGAVADAGIAEVAAAVPEPSGEPLVRKVRAEVWGRPLEGVEHLPAGSAFALRSLGFLGDDPVQLFESGPWSRLTTVRGHVLIKRRAWTLAR